MDLLLDKTQKAFEEAPESNSTTSPQGNLLGEEFCESACIYGPLQWEWRGKQDSSSNKHCIIELIYCERVASVDFNMNDILDQIRDLPNPYNVIYDDKSNRISLVLDINGAGAGNPDTISSLNNLLSIYNNPLGIVKQPETLLRKGKWTIEEEQYANKIIDVFNKGYLTDVVSGVTLRSYLSDRLRCDPMRITKKYAGNNCIGKQVFQGIQDKNVTPEEIRANDLDLQRLETIFYKKLGRFNRLQYGFVDQETEEALYDGARSPESAKQRRPLSDTLLANHAQRSPTAISGAHQYASHAISADHFPRRTSSMPELKEMSPHPSTSEVVSDLDDSSSGKDSGYRKRTHSYSQAEKGNMNDDNAAELLMAFFNGASGNRKKLTPNEEKSNAMYSMDTSQLRGLWVCDYADSLQQLDEKNYDSGDSRSNKSGSPVVTDSESRSSSSEGTASS